jgi:hypothetical protein
MTIYIPCFYLQKIVRNTMTKKKRDKGKNNDLQNIAQKKNNYLNGLVSYCLYEYKTNLFVHRAVTKLNIRLGTIDATAIELSKIS